MRPANVTIAALCLIAAAGASAQNWPSFRGAGGSGLGNGAAPVTWDVAKPENIVWKTNVSGVALSSPIVWEDRIYLTTAVALEPARGEDFRTRHVWRVMSLDRATGKILWDTAAYQGTPQMGRHPKSSYANSTPATDGRYVVAMFGTDAFACVDKSGKLLWRKEMQLDSKNDDFHFGSSPVIVEDLAILQDDREHGSYVAAYRLQDGQEVWKVARTEGPAQSTPVVTWTRGSERRPLVILAGGKYLRAVDARSGREVWKMAANTQAVSSSPVVAGDIVYFAGGGGKKPVYAFRADAAGDISLASGQRNNAGVVWSTERGGTYIPSPLVVGEQLYVLGDNGVLAAYNVHNGRQLFQERAGTGDFYASPVAADGKLYLFNTDGDVTVLRAGPTFEVLARNRMNEPTMATPAIVDGTLYVRTAGHMVALRGAGSRR